MRVVMLVEHMVQMEEVGSWVMITRNRIMCVKKFRIASQTSQAAFYGFKVWSKKDSEMRGNDFTMADLKKKSEILKR
jgi:hypothetical protein